MFISGYLSSGYIVDWWLVDDFGCFGFVGDYVEVVGEGFEGGVGFFYVFEVEFGVFWCSSGYCG